MHSRASIDASQRDARVPLRVLIVEDELLVAALLQDMLEELGYTGLGPVATLERALALVAEIELDAAVLDISLNGVPVYPVAEVLLRRGIPFVFTTGYGKAEIPKEWQEVVTLQKPFGPSQFAVALEAILSQPG